MSEDQIRDQAERVARVHLAQRTLGCAVTRASGLSLARDADVPLIWDANFAFDVEPSLAADGDAFSDALDRAFAGSSHQKVVCDATTAPIVEARLAAAGFEAEAILQLVLDGPLEPAMAARAEGADVTIEAADDDADWAALTRLKHADFDEQAARLGRPPYGAAVAEQMVACWRSKAGMRFWIARRGGTPCAYLGSWSGREELGMVEYLFTDPSVRHRGIATALIAHGVETVRAEGASAVLIGAEVEDTPKQMYLDLGFRPVCITREWLRHHSDAAAEG